MEFRFGDQSVPVGSPCTITMCKMWFHGAFPCPWNFCSLHGRDNGDRYLHILKRSEGHVVLAWSPENQTLGQGNACRSIFGEVARETGTGD